MMVKNILIFGFILVLVACSPSPDVAQWAIEQTQEAIIVHATQTTEPTKTLEPTEIPAPTTEPTISEEEVVSFYVEEIVFLMGNFGDNLQLLADFTYLITKNPNLTTDRDFVNEYFRLLDEVYDVLVEMSKISPPLQMEEFYYYLISAKDEFFIVRSLIKSGVRNSDMLDLASAIIHMKDFNKYFSSAANVLLE